MMDSSYYSLDYENDKWLDVFAQYRAAIQQEKYV